MSGIVTLQLHCNTSNNVDVTLPWNSIARPPRLPRRQTSVPEDTLEADDSSPSIGPNDSANNLSPKLPCGRGPAVTGTSPSPPNFACRDPPSTEMHSERVRQEEGNGHSFPPCVILVPSPRALGPPSRRYTSVMPIVGGRCGPLPKKTLSCNELEKLNSIRRPPRLPHRQTSVETPHGGEGAAPVTP